ncbi:MAG: XylR family transcriptional regulator, partial [Phycisphaerae bacterium]|nr:XylR family transcriptional regulator [Phycisphaerae bacterium]
DRAIGHQAAEHLLRNGFTQFGFVGYRGVYWSDHRCDGFREAVESAGGTCDMFMSESMAASRCELRSWDRELDQMAEWLKALPKPVGVMAATDFRAVQVLDACRQAGVAVPEQVAVIGVDDEEVVRELAHPPLSSIRTNAEQVGYRAAEMLAMLMAGNEPPVRKLFVKPLGVAARQSTDLTAIEDPVVAKAMSFIRREACRGINVEDVLRHLSISRSVIQRRFRKQLGRTVHDEIIATRVGRTKELLAQTDLSLSQIAERVGIAHIEYLSAMFKRRTGLTLSAYRRSTRRALRAARGRRGSSVSHSTTYTQANP